VEYALCITASAWAASAIYIFTTGIHRAFATKVADLPSALFTGIALSIWAAVPTEALRQFLDIIPDRPIYALGPKDNAASAVVLAKGGFVVVGEDRFINTRGEEREEWVFELR
jgi:hypothetical protein